MKNAVVEVQSQFERLQKDIKGVKTDTSLL